MLEARVQLSHLLMMSTHAEEEKMQLTARQVRKQRSNLDSRPLLMLRRHLEPLQAHPERLQLGPCAEKGHAQASTGGDRVQ